MNLADKRVGVRRDLDVAEIVILIARACEGVVTPCDQRGDNDEFAVASLDTKRLLALGVALDHIGNGGKSAALRLGKQSLP